MRPKTKQRPLAGEVPPDAGDGPQADRHQADQDGGGLVQQGRHEQSAQVECAALFVFGMASAGHACFINLS